MRALPEPKRHGSVDSLRPLLNIPDGKEGEADFILAVAYALACLRGRGPYPVMAVSGEQGSAKSTRSAMLRNLVDPGKPTLRASPRDEHDLVIAARNRHVLAFDNVSGLKWWLSDALCRIASGAGFGARTLYTDDEETVFEGARPLIINGIEDAVERPDLAERAIFSVCKPIDDKDRKSEGEVWASFNEAHASILGALLDAAPTGLKRFSEIRPPALPRMADFAHWAIACEPALWREGAFLDAYRTNILGAVESVLEASPVAVAVRQLMASLAKESPPKAKREATSSELLTLLKGLVDEQVSKSDDWPRNARALSGRLRRAASFLRRVGVEVAFNREAGTGARRIVITATPPTSGTGNRGNFASQPSQPSPEKTPPKKNNGLGADGGDGGVTKGDANRFERDGGTDEGDGGVTVGADLTVTAKSLNSNGVGPAGDDRDGSDANLRPSTALAKGSANKDRTEMQRATHWEGRI
jgi:hypothetical protein